MHGVHEIRHDNETQSLQNTLIAATEQSSSVALVTKHHANHGETITNSIDSAHM